MYTIYGAHGPHGPKGPLGAYGVYGHAPHTYHIYFYRGLVTSWTSNALGAQQHLKGLRGRRRHMPITPHMGRAWDLDP